MKLLIVTCISEHKEIVLSIFRDAHIAIFSMNETTGFKESHPANMPDNWFGNVGEQFDSLSFFSFTADESATAVLSRVNAHNKLAQPDFPIHAFIMPVENHSI